MDIHATYTFDAPVQTVWDLLMDTERVAACIPGCDRLEPLGDNRYRARLTVAQNRGFGGVPGNSRARHVVMVVRTDMGWFVVEPQTTVLAPLHEYANLSSVVEMTF